MKKTISKVKETGATFTPKLLADYLADQILSCATLTDETLTVLDPACGDGELLLAIGEALTTSRRSFKLYGYDINQDYVERSKERLSEKDYDFELHCCDFLLESDPPKADLLIANPPYVRTQILGEEKAQRLAEKYNLKGRVDLYYPFLIEMSDRLKPGGTIGVITSNRYLYTKSGESVRTFLAKHLEIKQVIDLGDTKLFENAAVLPAIFIGQKKEAPRKEVQKARYIKTYEEQDDVLKASKSTTIYELLKSEQTGLFKIGKKTIKQSCGQLQTNTRDSHWQLLTAEEIAWVEQVRSVCPYTVKDLAKVRVGVKTTADNVFIRSDWDEMPNKLRPDEDVLHPILSQQDIERWQAPSANDNRILYTHEDHNDKKRVIDFSDRPRTLNYLESHRKQLEGRSYVIKAKRKWYEIWVPQQPRLWRKAKLIIPDISEKARFHLDTDGAIVNGNCYWISQEDVGNIDWLLLIQGMANSEVMAVYHDLCFNNRLYSGRRRYLTQYVENYPLPEIGTPAAKSIIAVVRQLNKASQKGKDIAKFEDQLNEIVANLLGVSADVSQGRLFPLYH